MLEPHEKQAFDSMVARLSDNDPRFTRRVDRLGRPRLTLAIVLWVLAPVAIWQGGWTGFFLAIVGVAYGVHLAVRSGQLQRSPVIRS